MAGQAAPIASARSIVAGFLVVLAVVYVVVVTIYNPGPAGRAPASSGHGQRRNGR
jgi:hypothetical protein